jgi:hypothetical protein
VRSVIEPPLQTRSGEAAKPVFRVGAARGVKWRSHINGMRVMCSLVLPTFRASAVHFITTPDPEKFRVICRDPPQS